jgi:lipoprotein-anchoring transpeptidase ErfK/SrfK
LHRNDAYVDEGPVMANAADFGILASTKSSAARVFLAAAAIILLPLAMSGTAQAQTLSYAPQSAGSSWNNDQLSSPQIVEDEADGTEVPERLKRTVVSFNPSEPAGTIVIDTGNTYLYYVLGGGRAIRYGVGVGREGFTWSGVQPVSRKAVWPDWNPPAEMIARQPYLPRFMAGGPGNPLGAAAMYLGSSAYRIHGTNAPSTIGKFVSSGCIRLTNDDVQDLAARVQIGTRVVVLAKNAPMQANVVKPAAVSVTKPTPVNGNLPVARSLQNVKLSGLY